jgi:hypothetical protein
VRPLKYWFDGYRREGGSGSILPTPGDVNGIQSCLAGRPSLSWCWLCVVFMDLLTISLTHLLNLLIHSPTHSPTRSLNHPLTHPITHSSGILARAYLHIVLSPLTSHLPALLAGGGTLYTFPVAHQWSCKVKPFPCLFRLPFQKGGCRFVFTLLFLSLPKQWCVNQTFSILYAYIDPSLISAIALLTAACASPSS